VRIICDPHVLALSCVDQICVNILFGDSAGKKKSLSASMAALQHKWPFIQKPITANDHEANSNSKDKYSQPRWYPSGLTHTQKRRLQRLRRQEQKKQEAEKLRDEHFDKYRPMIP